MAINACNDSKSKISCKQLRFNLKMWVEGGGEDTDGGAEDGRDDNGSGAKSAISIPIWAMRLLMLSFIMCLNDFVTTVLFVSF